MSGCASLGEASLRASPHGAVVILGGGVAGLTAAWRLVQKGHKVEIYEAAERLGGRMWTQRSFNDEGMFCEIGGELVDSNHAALRGLAAELGVGIQRLYPRASQLGDRYLINKKLYADGDVITASRAFMRKVADDQAGLETKSGEPTPAAHALDAMSLGDYLNATARATGTPAWLSTLLDVAYTTEYGVETNRQSAMNFLCMVEPGLSDGLRLYGESDEAYRVAGGSERLIVALEQRLKGRVILHRKHRLTQIEDDGKALVLTFATASGHQRVRCEKAISTLPFSILREVRGMRGLGLSAGKRRAIAEFGYGAHAKMMFGFRERFWEKLAPVQSGGLFSEGDFQTWNTSVAQGGSRGVLTCFIAARAARRLAPAPHYLARIAEVWPAAAAAFDGRKTVMDWTHFALSRGSYSATLAGQYFAFPAAAAAPELGGRLLFAGEHTSADFPGYMNGAIESGLRVAQEV